MPETATCTQCGEANATTQRFCGACGGLLSRACPACRAPNPPGYRFCGGCGAALDASAPRLVEPGAEERRWATVVFADLSGFTDLSERTDPEDVRALVDGCTVLLGEIVDRFGGTINQIVGDAVLAVFGAPVAHEDDAERAVRAAMEMRRCARERAADFGDLPLRIGVNTGEVMFAPVGPESHRRQTVMGDVVNTASRLQTSAPRDSVLVGEETWRATRQSIRYDPVEPFRVKGKEEPLYAWLAVEPVAAPADRPLSAVPMVGRDGELDVLCNTWDRVVRDGRPHLVTVLGAPGIGKSRLCREFRTWVEARGGRVLKGRSLPYGESTGYGAFAQLIEEAAGVFETDSAETVRDKLTARVSELVPETEAAVLTSHLAVIVGLDTEGVVSDRRALFASARRFVEALAREQPTVFGVEDSHWSEPSLLDLIEHLAARVRDVPALILNSARPELFDTRPGWGGGLPAYSVLPVEELTDAQAVDLSRHLLGTDALSPEVAARLNEVAGGNPLFIEELAAALSEGAADATQALPTSVLSIIAARLDVLPIAERRVLLDASVVGRTFWRGALARLGGESGLDAALDALEARDFIRREATSAIEGDTEFSFRHMLIREVAYGTLPHAARRERHATVAEFAEETAGDRRVELAPILAHHWREAGELDRAVDYLSAAAAQAARTWAKREAVALYGEALDLLAKDDPRRNRIRMARAVAHQAALHIAYGDAVETVAE